MNGRDREVAFFMLDSIQSQFQVNINFRRYGNNIQHTIEITDNSTNKSQMLTFLV